MLTIFLDDGGVIRTALVGAADLPGFEPSVRIPTLAHLPAGLASLTLAGYRSSTITHCPDS